MTNDCKQQTAHNSATETFDICCCFVVFFLFEVCFIFVFKRLRCLRFAIRVFPVALGQVVVLICFYFVCAVGFCMFVCLFVCSSVFVICLVGYVFGCYWYWWCCCCCCWSLLFVVLLCLVFDRRTLFCLLFCVFFFVCLFVWLVGWLFAVVICCCWCLLSFMFFCLCLVGCLFAISCLLQFYHPHYCDYCFCYCHYSCCCHYCYFLLIWLFVCLFCCFVSTEIHVSSADLVMEKKLSCCCCCSRNLSDRPSRCIDVDYKHIPRIHERRSNSKQ